MKKAFLALAIPALLVACNSVGDGEFVLHGTIKGADGKNIILKRQDSIGPVSLDTAKIENGKFEFKGKNVTEPEMFGLQVDGSQAISPFIAESGNIEIEIHGDSIQKNKISGTYNNDKFAEYAQMTAKLNENIGKEWKKLQPMYIMAQSKKDTAAIMKIQTQMETMQKNVTEKVNEWTKNNPKAYISIFLIQNNFRTFEPDMDLIESLYKNLDPELKKTKAGKKLLKNIEQFKVVKEGRRAPEFSAASPDGKQVSLKEARGKVTIIDFWASWCGPCRKANPELVAIYNELHPKGLNIIGVSLDKPGQADKWKEAIAKDGLAWTQVSNLKEWNDPIAKRYNVEEIPTNFVVNQYGIVVGKNLHGDALKAKINEWLSKPNAPK